MVVIALTAEGTTAAFLATVGADRSTTVTALRHRRLAARSTHVAVTGYVFDLAERCHREWAVLNYFA